MGHFPVRYVKWPEGKCFQAKNYLAGNPKEHCTGNSDYFWDQSMTRPKIPSICQVTIFVHFKFPILVVIQNSVLWSGTSLLINSYQFMNRNTEILVPPLPPIPSPTTAPEKYDFVGMIIPFPTVSGKSCFPFIFQSPPVVATTSHYLPSHPRLPGPTCANLHFGGFEG